MIAGDQGHEEIAACLRRHGGKVNYAFVAWRSAHRAMIHALAPFLYQH